MEEFATEFLSFLVWNRKIWSSYVEMAELNKYFQCCNLIDIHYIHKYIIFCQNSILFLSMNNEYFNLTMEYTIF